MKNFNKKIKTMLTIGIVVLGGMSASAQFVDHLFTSAWAGMGLKGRTNNREDTNQAFWLDFNGFTGYDNSLFVFDNTDGFMTPRPISTPSLFSQNIWTSKLKFGTNVQEDFFSITPFNEFYDVQGQDIYQVRFTFNNANTSPLVLYKDGMDTGYINSNSGITANAISLRSSLGSNKISLYGSAGSTNEFYGFGINSATLRYQVDTRQANHVFYAGTGATTSTELMRIEGDGNVGIGFNDSSSTIPAGAPTSASAKLHIYENFGTVATAPTATAGAKGSLIIAHGNRGGESSIVFPNSVGSTGDYAFIKYDEDVTDAAGSSTNNGRLTIGIANDPAGSDNENIAIMPSRSVGINNLYPQATLDVIGTVNATGLLTATGGIQVGASSLGAPASSTAAPIIGSKLSFSTPTPANLDDFYIDRINEYNGSSNLFLNIGNDGYGTNTDVPDTFTIGQDANTGAGSLNSLPYFTVNSAGYVGIGTIGDKNYDLSVNGPVEATNYAVTTAMTADYVFEDSYKLKTLAETEAYIKENKHLPAFKSAKHYEANGYTMIDMDVALEQTVEELTLHAIAQEKKIVAQETEMTQLKSEMAAIKALLLKK